VKSFTLCAFIRLKHLNGYALMTDKNRATVLLITSAQSSQLAFKEILDGTGFKLDSASSAEEGVHKAIELLPSIIIIETSPNTNGFETCRRLRASRVLEGIPIVMLVEREETDTRAVGLSAGADDFLDKPLDGLQILARLRSLSRFNRERYLLADLTRFSWMVEHAHEGYLMLDRSGAIHYANDRAINLLNMPEDFFGLPFVNVVERQYLPKPTETWQSWLEDPAPCFLIQPESPTARAVWVVLEALEPPAGVEYMRLTRLRDVTERMAIYQDMRRFHTVVAHKLRTPMSMLMMSMSIIKSQLDVLTPEEIKNMLDSAIKGTDRLAEEIRSILTYIDAPLALNLGAPMTLKELPEMVKTSCEVLHLANIMFSMPENLQPITLAMTPFAMEMILHELFENSRKFHPTHEPQIEVSVGQTEPDFIHLRLSDNGLTLSVEQLEWAWLPYFQGEKDFTGELPGLGLGFPMVATLVWKAGGTINLRNRLNSPGVVVDIRIPLESTMRKMERSAAPYGS
jgi:signal transduction histidine kinase